MTALENIQQLLKHKVALKEERWFECSPVPTRWLRCLGYLKLWQLKEPKPCLSDRYDVIFIDEAQDCTPGESHDQVTWPSHMARSHDQVTWPGHMTRSHGQDTWPGHMTRTHGQVT